MSMIEVIEPIIHLEEHQPSPLDEAIQIELKTILDFAKKEIGKN